MGVERPLELTWGENPKRETDKVHVEWHAPCGCAFHPKPFPHIHPCSNGHKRPDLHTLTDASGSVRLDATVSTPTVATSRAQMNAVLGEPPWTLEQIAKEFEFITVGALLEIEQSATSTPTEELRCEHGVLQSMECLNCTEEYVAASTEAQDVDERKLCANDKCRAPRYAHHLNLKTLEYEYSLVSLECERFQP